MLFGGVFLVALKVCHEKLLGTARKLLLTTEQKSLRVDATTFWTPSVPYRSTSLASTYPGSLSVGLATAHHRNAIHTNWAR